MRSARRRREVEAGIQALMRKTWAQPEPEQEQREVEPEPPARRFGAYARREETT